MENSFSTADVSEIKKQITELYDSSKKSIEKHEKQIITGINLIKKEQNAFFTKLLDLLSKNDPNSNENTDMSPSTKNNSIIFGKLADPKPSSKKPKSKTPIKRNNNKHLTSSNNKSDFSNKQTYLKSFYKNSSYNKVCSPSIKIANIIKKSLKEKMNANMMNGTSKVKCIKKKLFCKKSNNLNRSNTLYSNSSQLNTNKNCNSNKISFNKLSKTILHRNVQSTELISVNDNNNSFISNKDCILLKDESISKEMQNQHPFQTELRKLSIIDIPFSINTNSNGSPSPNDNNIPTTFPTNTINDTIFQIVNILINGDILPVKDKITLSTLTKSIHAIHTPLKIISNHINFLNKCISHTKYELEMLIFRPSLTAQITMQFMSNEDENCIYSNISFAKAIYILICNDDDLSYSSKDDIIKEIYSKKHKEKLCNILLCKEVLSTIKEMDCLKCEKFIEVIDTFYNGSNNTMGDKNNFNGIIKENVYNKIMFYINEVYLYIKERYGMLSAIHDHIETMKKCQQIEIVFKLKQ